jgi:hypothetical protein
MNYRLKNKLFKKHCNLEMGRQNIHRWKTFIFNVQQYIMFQKSYDKRLPIYLDTRVTN